ncbi:MAG: ABC transporter permease [Anaerolineaceae bacterium]|jgi:ABC-2 type transport system permease protein
MKQVLNIAWKDIKHMFRDRTGLVINIAAPLLLTLAIAFALGGLGSSSNDSGLKNIPVFVVNHDTGQFGAEMVQFLNPSTADIAASPDLQQIKDLLTVTVTNDEAGARKQVDNGKVAAVVIIPVGFSESILPASATTNSQTQSVVQVYGDPNQQLRASVTESVVQSIINQMVAGAVAGQVAIKQLVGSGRLPAAEAAQQAPGIVQPLVQNTLATSLISLNHQVEGPTSASGGFDWLTYMAPSMAVLYLMFAMSQSARTILQEKQMGTLPRMLVSPTSRSAVLGGKLLGAYANGLLMMAVLIVGGKLFFNISYGALLPVLLFTLALVAAATAWGMAEAAFARSSAQANQVGWIINLSFAALAGNFVPRTSFPVWMQQIGYISPNAWGIETYGKLIHGAGLVDIWPAIIILLAMAVLLFGLSSIIFGRRFA